MEKIYNTVGGMDEPIHPYEIINNDGDKVDIKNIKEQIDNISLLNSEQANGNEELLRGIANVVGTRSLPMYPRSLDGSSEEIENIAEEVQQKTGGSNELLQKIANVTGTSEFPVNFSDISEENNIGKLIKDSKIVTLNIAKVTGAIEEDPSSYPATLPITMKGNEAATLKIQSTPEMLAYLLKYLDSTLGQYPVPIKIKDTDKTKEGDQSKDIKLPNISESLAELYAISFTRGKSSEAVTRGNLEMKTSLYIGFRV